MILVDPDIVGVNKPTIPDPLADSVKSLDSKLNTIIDSAKTFDHNTLLEYHQTLLKYLNRIDQMKQRYDPPSKITPPSSGDSNLKIEQFERRVIDSLPPSLQKRGRLLIDHIKDATDISWNTRGELIKRGEVIGGSNISDMVHELLRARRSSNEPRGWGEFTTSLKASNIPNDLIGNKIKWEEASKTDISPTKKELTPKTPQSTPHRKKKKTKRGKMWTPY